MISNFWPKLAKSQLEMEVGWMCGLCVLLVEPRVQQGDIFLVSDTALFSTVGLLAQR